MRVKANNLTEKPSAVLVNNEELPQGTDPPPTYKQSESLANMYVPPPHTISGTQTPLYWMDGNYWEVIKIFSFNESFDALSHKHFDYNLINYF